MTKCMASSAQNVSLGRVIVSTTIYRHATSRCDNYNPQNVESGKMPRRARDAYCFLTVLHGFDCLSFESSAVWGTSLGVTHDTD